MKLLIQFSVILLLLNINFSFAQDSTNTKKTYITKLVNISEAPTIDGLLSDIIWDKVEWGNNFIENTPDENTPPNQQTQFKIVYDEKNLYVGIRAFDTAPDSIVKRLSRRDGFVGDRVNVVIDSYNDKRTAFVFTVTAAGVKGDEFATDNGNNIDDSWNPIWYTKSAIDKKGWTAEMKIPFSQLRFGKAKEQIWGLNIARTIFRHSEMSVWNRIPVDAPGWVSEMGELHGLTDLKPQKQLEIQPFTVTQYETYPAEAGNPFRDGSDFKLNAGLDAKIGITNDLTLDLTVNPDFGQVEADPGAINLDGFEIFFREQRPFFVENNNIFNYNFGGNQDNLFFSRRIGRSPQGFSSTASGAFVDQPRNTTILGAAKFSGKTKNGWSIGILESVTGKGFAEIDTNGERSKELVEPLTNYFVGRLQKDFNNRNSYIGGIFTATNRKLENNLDFLRKSAYTGGLDFKHQWKDRKYFVEGHVVASHVSGSKEAITNTQMSLTHLFQRVDAGHVDVDPNRTSLSGTGGRFAAGKVAGGNWTYNGGLIWRSPELELNDIGFLRQADEIRQYLNVGYKTLKPFGAFRSISARFSHHTTYDFEGNHNRTLYSVGGRASFKNNYWIDFKAVHKPRIYINTILRGGPRWRFSQEDHISAFVGTDERKKLRTNFGFAYSGAKQNNFEIFYIGGDITYEPNNSLRISIGPDFRSNPNKTQYVTQTDFNGTPRYILAKIDNKSLSASIRLNYTVNPNLSIQYYGQPFISRANYTDFKYVTNSIADNLYDRFHQFTDNQISFDQANGVYLVDEDIDGNIDYAIGKPDFSFVQFRSNLVVRWEYIPGSEIFLVWSQGVTSFADSSDDLFDGLKTGILNQKPENIFLLKMTYRFVL
ncbi:carbohydrate binding family 9 domain-containing protein [Flavobacteriaceae bacterium AH-315-B10]|nr:carbohydrate binding family 9 domain-containing protein [Flavobacteriaceae bacterium AH-315-B10]